MYRGSVLRTCKRLVGEVGRMLRPVIMVIALVGSGGRRVGDFFSFFFFPSAWNPVVEEWETVTE